MDPRLDRNISERLHEGSGESNWEQKTSVACSRAPSAVEGDKSRIAPHKSGYGKLRANGTLMFALTLPLYQKVPNRAFLTH